MGSERQDEMKKAGKVIDELLISLVIRHPDIWDKFSENIYMDNAFKYLAKIYKECDRVAMTVALVDYLKERGYIVENERSCN